MMNFQIVNRATGLTGMPVALARKAAICFPVGSVIWLIPAAPRWAIFALDMLRLPLAHAWTRAKVMLFNFCILAVEFFAALLTIDQTAATAMRGSLTSTATIYLAFKQSIGLYSEQLPAYLARYFNLGALCLLMAGIRTIVQVSLFAVNVIKRFGEFFMAVGAYYVGASAVRHGITPYEHYTIIPHYNQANTLIAAHRTGRRCYGMEIAPRYADVILRRAEAEGLTVERV